jgi:hypothetical protein
MFAQTSGGSLWRFGFFRRFGVKRPQGTAAQAWRLFVDALCNALRAPHC